MSLQNNIMAEMKVAMKNKNKTALEALRAIKAAILLAQTDTGAKKNLSEAEENKILQKLAKQRKESIEIFTKEHRSDLAEKEIAQLDVIEKFLPKQMSQEDLEKIINQTLSETGVTSMKDMGKVMPVILAKTAGAADGKTISSILKSKLT